ncbi:MAG: TatD family hydrolase [Gammaproteobacteria bacterium]|nr:TatD family hydrolase [Gammaproteobacteria bacterium]
MLVDSHCHIDFDALSEDLPALLKACDQADVQHLLAISVTLEHYPRVKALIEHGPGISVSCGVHPCYENVKEPSVEELVALCNDDDVVAVGETGLDYFRTDATQDMAWQHQRFERHIEAAKRVEKPLIIHTRAAADDTMDKLEQHGATQCGGVMHCFAENWEIAKRALDIGFYISFSGILTFKNATDVHDVARKVPMDRVLFETDAPYLAPVPYRGKLNQPAYVRHTAEHFANLRGLSIQEVEAASTANFFNLFKGATAHKKAA